MNSALRGLAGRVRWWWPRQRHALLDFLLTSVIGARWISRTTRPALLRAVGLDVSKNVTFESGVVIRAGRALHVGPYSFVNTECVLDLQESITIGSNVHLAHRVMLLTVSHEAGGPQRRAGDLAARPIVVEDGCWLGASVVVLPGVRIARGCIVAAGAVVVADTEPDGLYAGVPAARVRELSTA
ncbi:hypothetical protein M6D93_01375 [Jatrophihabitans telluris]|uniref:Acyltransferase n=1 Tax=Jatrophihabitans telluris TaxID=2038343 RepID=A0ABY4R0I3_9ACTN|nr:DapH/DapD/GlmU-related protein [Jatrophihabitans telluris]UQX88665.1 hypothetical protein M6D93_01375 [Jatrophihabitans telluris]